MYKLASLRAWFSKKQSQLLPKTSMEARFIRGTFWSFAGLLISQGLSLAALILSARFLGKANYGEYGIINSTVVTFGVFAGIGLGITASKYIAEWRNKEPERAGRILGLSSLGALLSGSVFSILLFVFSPFLARNIFIAPHLTNILRLSCFALFFNTLYEVQIGSLAGLEVFRTISLVNLIRGILQFPLILSGVYFFGLSGLVLGIGISSAMGWYFGRLILLRECTRRNIVITYRGIRSEIPILWKFSIPAFITNAMVGPILWVANTIIVNQPDGYSQMGILNAVYQWRNILLFLPIAIANAALPMMSSIFSDHGLASQSDHSVEITNVLNQVVLWPIAIFLLFSAKAIMSLYGSDFVEGRDIFILLIGGTALGYISYPVGVLILSKGLIWIAVLQNLIWGGLFIISTYILSPIRGAFGLAIAMVIAYFVFYLFSVVYMYLRGDLPSTLARRIIMSGQVMLLFIIIAEYIPSKIALLLAIPLAILAIPMSLYLLASQEIKVMIGKFLHSIKSKPIKT
jgi:O-antigen/teichoic acid export membrane protein